MPQTSLAVEDSVHTSLLRIDSITYDTTVAEIAKVTRKHPHEIDTSDPREWVLRDVSLLGRSGQILITRDSVIREVKWKIPVDTLETHYNAVRDSAYALHLTTFGVPFSGHSTSAIWNLAGGFYSFVGFNSLGSLYIRWSPNLSESEQKRLEAKRLRALAKDLEESGSNPELLELIKLLLLEEEE
jgi:hypothetical protein